MDNFRTKLKQGGYDAEDAYFYKRDLELIEETRKTNRLILLQGGKSEDPLALPKGSGQGAKKKAA